MSNYLFADGSLAARDNRRKIIHGYLKEKQTRLLLMVEKFSSAY